LFGCLLVDSSIQLAADKLSFLFVDACQLLFLRASMVGDSAQGVRMADYKTNQFKAGLKILIDGEPCSIVSNEMVKPGKGQAFNRVKIRFLKSGKVIEKTYKSGESVPAADVVELEVSYLYNDSQHWVFMDQKTYEQIEVSAAAIAPVKDWLKEEDQCQITLFDGQPLVIDLPNFVQLKVVQCEPGVKGDTVSGGSKWVTLETGAQLKVPLFISLNDVLKIDTRTCEYVSRVNE
jgi:elongation factor P